MEGFYVSQPMGGQPQNPAAAAQAQGAAPEGGFDGETGGEADASEGTETVDADFTVVDEESAARN